MTELENSAKELGLEVKHANPATHQRPGYLRISGTISEVLRAWAVAGYDRKQSTERSWNFYLDGEYAGLCVAQADFAYSFTTCI